MRYESCPVIKVVTQRMAGSGVKKKWSYKADTKNKN